MSDLSSLFGYDQFIFDIPNTIYYIDLTKEPVFFFLLSMIFSILMTLVLWRHIEINVFMSLGDIPVFISG
jgi:hypothetical protein